VPGKCHQANAIKKGPFDENYIFDPGFDAGLRAIIKDRQQVYQE
jgi:hypothetical protein